VDRNRHAYGSRRSVGLRPSEFVLNYGPGSIVVTPDGPGVALLPEAAPDDSGVKALLERLRGNPGMDLDITPLVRIDLTRIVDTIAGGSHDEQKRHILGDDVRVYRVPTDMEFGENGFEWPGTPFPSYYLCTNAQGHRGNGYVLFRWRQGGIPRCPECGRNEVQPIRYIMICNRGHMDDINWDEVVHRGQECKLSSGSEPYYYWIGSGSPSSIRIRCASCQSEIRLVDLYGSPLRCTGRYPERGSAHERDDARPHDAYPTQRGSSNVHVPVTLALMVVPPLATDLHGFLRTPLRDNTLLANALKYKYGDGPLTKRILEEFHESHSPDFPENAWTWYLERRDEVDDSELDRAWRDLRSFFAEHVSASYGEIMDREFEELMLASRNGYPPSTTGREYSLLEVDPNDSRETTVEGITFHVTPVKRLTVVLTQIGYQRVARPEEDVRTVSVCSRLGDRYWCPGVRQFGEGLFIYAGDKDNGEFDACGADFSRDSGACDEWKRVHDERESYPGHLFRDAGRRVETSPLFVWWHTFSHMLMRELSADAGYPLASIRERVYAIPSEGSPWSGRAGILIYTYQRGSEGTLGGLISLAGEEDGLRNYMLGALRRAERCSNDPLCGDSRVVFPRFNGAACYACSFVPETSCEHRNAWLDRRLIRGQRRSDP